MEDFPLIPDIFPLRGHRGIRPEYYLLIDRHHKYQRNEEAYNYEEQGCQPQVKARTSFIAIIPK